MHWKRTVNSVLLAVALAAQASAALGQDSLPVGEHLIILPVVPSGSLGVVAARIIVNASDRFSEPAIYIVDCRSQTMTYRPRFGDPHVIKVGRGDYFELLLNAICAMPAARGTMSTEAPKSEQKAVPTLEVSRREPTPPPEPKKPRTPELSSTGTGFFVNASGYLLTNAHVVEECSRIAAKRSNGEVLDARLVATDSRNDLALLKASGSPSWAVFRRGSPPLGESLAVYGFPLIGTLATTGNLTTGTLSGLAGLGNEPGHYQISAPVQAGNSGGAVLDESGLTIGVVVGKLDAAMLQQKTGELPQNVNFAIKGTLAQNFLESRGVGFHDRQPGAARKVSAVADEAMKYTVLVGCFK